MSGMDPHNELNPHMDHYIGIDVGTGSARACVIDAKGDIIGLASENIGLWQPEQGYYVSLQHRRKYGNLVPGADGKPQNRNNPPTTSGVVSAIPSSVSSINTT